MHLIDENLFAAVWCGFGSLQTCSTHTLMEAPSGGHQRAVHILAGGFYSRGRSLCGGRYITAMSARDVSLLQTVNSLHLQRSSAVMRGRHDQTSRCLKASEALHFLLWRGRMELVSSIPGSLQHSVGTTLCFSALRKKLLWLLINVDFSRDWKLFFYLGGCWVPKAQNHFRCYGKHFGGIWVPQTQSAHKMYLTCTVNLFIWLPLLLMLTDVGNMNINTLAEAEVEASGTLSDPPGNCSTYWGPLRWQRRSNTNVEA